MAENTSLPPLREVLAAHGIRADKRLGQHFLLDLNLTRKIARAAGDLTDATVVEIGPGPGGLTRALLELPLRQLIAIEKDADFLGILEQVQLAYPATFTLQHTDALKVKMATLTSGQPLHIVANLPYNISTELLINWLGEAEAIAGMTLMFQREVAERLYALPRTKAYGRLSILAQWRCAVHKCFDVPPEAFTPPPKVMSTIVQLIPRTLTAEDVDAKALQRVTAAAFGQRRKMLRVSLKSVFAQPETVLTECGIAPTARAEELTVAQFCALARRPEMNAAPYTPSAA